MPIGNDWYTTNYQQAAVYTTLTVMATIDNNPFTFSRP